ncbi:MAG: ABC transporter permease [Chloroflexi bacterium]|nr:ABC transporter permease [Chloroflexota bacterium]
MWRYVVQRLLISVPVFFGITILVFTMISLAPGDPVLMVIPLDQIQQATPEELQAIRASLGLDKPVPVRYTLWLKEAVRGNLGSSLKWHTRVSDMLQERMGATLRLAVASLLLSLALGIPAGIVMALRQYSKLDYALSIFVLAQWSTPAFFIALVLIYVFALHLQWLPAFGMATPGIPPSLWDQIKHLAMPAFILGMHNTAIWARYTRASVLDVMHADYVTTARAKGLQERVVTMRHVFRNALLPIVTLLGLSIPQLLSGAVITETIFSWPGMGQMIFAATMNRDYPVLMGVVSVSAILVLASNLLADLAYVVVDPRIRYS